jgi:O-antigen/teichoic acid export membrane protein
MKTKGDATSTSLRLVAQSSLIVFLGIALSKLLTYFYRVVIAREFGPETYGLFSLAIVVSSFFIMGASLGLPEGVLRYLAFYHGKKEVEKERHLFRSAFKILLISGIFTAAILYLTANLIATYVFHNAGLSIFLKMFGLFLPFSVISGFLLSSLLAFGHVGWNSLINNFLQNLVKVIVLLALLFLGVREESVIVSYVAGIALTCIAAYLALRYTMAPLLARPKLKQEEQRRVLREVFAYAWPIVFLSTVYTIFNWTDSIVIGYFMTATDVGIYSAAFTLISLFGIAPELFKQFFFPYIVKEYSRKNIALIQTLSQQVGKWIFALNLPLFLFMIAFPGAVLNVFFGPEYLAATEVLRILAFGGLFSSFNALLTNLLSMQGKSKLIMTDTICISGLDLVLNILLVPSYGLHGAAISTAFSLALLGTVMLIQVRNSTGIVPLKKKMLNIVFASLLPTVGLLLVRAFFVPSLETLIVAGIAFILAYGTLIVTFKALDAYDKDIFVHAWSSLQQKFRKTRRFTSGNNRANDAKH